jgi:hypothetical protein
MYKYPLGGHPNPNLLLSTVAPLFTSSFKSFMEISRNSRGNLKLGVSLDSPSLRTSDPRWEFLDLRGRAQGISFKILLLDLSM